MCNRLMEPNNKSNCSRYSYFECKYLQLVNSIQSTHGIIQETKKKKNEKNVEHYEIECLSDSWSVDLKIAVEACKLH